MKVLGVTSLIFVCVAAKGSGPYLPSGWKPDGPAFYLPSEVSKSLIEPQKDVVFSETEASGSDFLREYGPPKVQEVSQDISQQKLPDIVNEQLFYEAVVETNAAKDVVTDTAEQKIEVNAEVKAVEEALPVTESQSITTTESITNVVQEVVQINAEATTLANIIDDLGYLVEPTVAIVIPTEKITVEENAQTENLVLEDNVVEAQQLINPQQVSDQSLQIKESTINDAIEVTSAPEQSSSDVSEPVQLSSKEASEASVTQQTDINFEVISAVEEKVDIVEENVKKVANVVQNIPELIISLENEVKQAEAIQEVPAVVKDIAGSLDQAPEGFLEYGPPGFREYGPPKEDLRDNTIEEAVGGGQLIENSEVRRRRFSPKFSSPKSH